MTVTAPTGATAAQFVDILAGLVGQVNADINAVGAAAQAAPRLTAGTDLNDLDAPRTDWVTATIDSIANVPPGEIAGYVRTFWQSTTNRIQVWYTSGISTNVWIRFRGSSSWTAWKRMDAQYAIEQAALYTDSAIASVATQPGSGNKVVPVALTVGGAPASYASTSRGVRIPLDFAPTVSRWRVHVRNINPRDGINRSGAISVTGVWIGVHNGSGNFTGTPTQISVADATPSDGSEWVSKWVTTPIGGGSSFLLAYGFTAGAATQSVIGGGWTVADPADAINNAATKTAATTMPLDVWLEAEVPASTPVIAGVGDSLMSGVGATQPVHDSTVSQYARANGALPVHYSASGDAASASTDSNAYKWARWRTLSKPDAALVGMGSNDIFGGDSLATVQASYQALLAVVAGSLTKNIYAATIMPRDAVTGSMETTRRSFNTWLRSGTLATVRDVFDFVPGVSADDETLTPALTADGIHLTTAGYAANRDAVTRVIAPQPAAGAPGPAGSPGVADDASVATLLSTSSSTRSAGDARWLKLVDFNTLGDARYAPAVTTAEAADIRSDVARVASKFAPAGAGVSISRTGTTYSLRRGIGSGKYWRCDLPVLAGIPGGYSVNQIRHQYVETASKSLPVADASVASSGTWTSATQAAAYNGSYVYSATAGNFKTFTTPAGVTFVGLRTSEVSNAGLARVSIDGDATRATLLPTAQQYVTDGLYPNTILVANGGILNPTDRVYEGRQQNPGIWDKTAIVANDLTAGVHTVKVEVTGYFHTGNFYGIASSGSTAARVYLSGFVYGDPTMRATDSGVTLVQTDTLADQASAWEYAYETLPAGATTKTFTGNVHGYETQESIGFTVDGAAVTPADGSTTEALREVAITRVTKLLHPETSTTTIADITTVYTMDRRGLRVDATTNWRVNATVSAAYLMMPVNGTGKVGGVNFTKGNLAGWPGGAIAFPGVSDLNWGYSRSAAAWLWDGRAGGTFAVAMWVPAVLDYTRNFAAAATALPYIQDRPSGPLTKVYFPRASGTVPEAVTAASVTKSSARYAAAYFPAGADAALSAF